MTTTTAAGTAANVPTIYSLHDDLPLPVEDKYRLKLIGGKATSLIRLHHQQKDQEQFRIPIGFVLSVSFFQDWMIQVQTSKEWKDFVNTTTTTTTSSSPNVVTKEQCDAIQSYCVSHLQWAVTQKSELDIFLQQIFFRAENNNNNNNSNDRQLLLVAVRSSSPEEDLSKASFAGGYETALGVPIVHPNNNDNKNDALLQAVRHSFASVFDYRVVQYKLQHGMSVINPQIAIMVQLQLNSLISGVTFSLNPINNCYDEAVITSNNGLGETVVSGNVTPDAFVVDKIKHTILSQTIATKSNALWLNDSNVKGGTRQDDTVNTEPSLTEEQVLEIVDLVSRVERVMGCPVDIEWAIDKDDNLLHLLQARPITSYIPLFPELLTPPDSTGTKRLYLDLIALSQGFCDSLSPLGLDYWQRMLATAKPHMTHGADGLVYELHGREYILLSHLLACTAGDKLVHSMFTTQGGLMSRILPTINLEEYRPEAVTSKNKSVVWNLMSEMFGMIPGLIRGLWNPSKSMEPYDQVSEKLFELYRVDGIEETMSPSGAETFEMEVKKCLASLHELYPLIAGFMASFFAKWRLRRMFAGYTEALDLLSALDMDLDGNPTSEMGHDMVRLAKFPEIQRTKDADEFLLKVSNGSCSNEFSTEYNDFLLRFGCRGMKEIDMAIPRSREDQGDLFNRLKMINVDSNQILTLQKRKEDAHQKLLELATPLGKASSFLYYAGLIQRTGGYREHPKYIYVLTVDYLRRRALKISEQWVSEHRLDTTNDIFFLTIEQVTKGQQDPKLDLKQLVASTRAHYDAYAHVKNWPVLIDSRGKIFRAPSSSLSVEGGFSGDPISHGVVRGRAKVLHSPYEKPIHVGEILVTRATEPSWTPIFINAAGVVLEVGSALQHGAIIAREYGIPCVSGVDHATEKIRDGDLLEVDGTNGIVRILDEVEEKKEDPMESS